LHQPGSDHTALLFNHLYFDRVTSKIYWADASQKKIWSANQNGTDKVQVFSTGLMAPESIAVDWVGRNLYWTDSVMENIEVSTLDGQFRKILLSKNVTSPRGLVLDPRNYTYLMFWSDWGQNPRIERSFMDGSGRQVIVTSKVYWPNGLALDYTTRRLYFADAYLKYIDYCDYDGRNRHQVLASDMVRWVCSRSVVPPVVHLDYEVIERVDKDTGANMVVMRSSMSGLRALKVHARDREDALLGRCVIVCSVFYHYTSKYCPQTL
uniref:Low density lipoprotein receptor-related protein 2b n=1 Tax=Cynoglossus semilaevis TaxID=244447 RepID=A0A3P8V9P1_CYNSE